MDSALDVLKVLVGECCLVSEVYGGHCLGEGFKEELNVAVWDWLDYIGKYTSESDIKFGGRDCIISNNGLYLVLLNFDVEASGCRLFLRLGRYAFDDRLCFDLCDPVDYLRLVGVIEEAALLNSWLNRLG